MVKSKMMVCAETVIRDAETNAVSIINIIEEINSATLPAIIPRFVIFNLLERDDSDPSTLPCVLTVQLNEAELLKQPLTLQFGDNLKNRSIFTIGGLLIANPGQLLVTFTSGDTFRAEYVVTVTAPQPQVLEERQT